MAIAAVKQTAAVGGGTLGGVKGFNCSPFPPFLVSGVCFTLLGVIWFTVILQTFGSMFSLELAIAWFSSWGLIAHLWAAWRLYRCMWEWSHPRPAPRNRIEVGRYWAQVAGHGRTGTVTARGSHDRAGVWRA